jgi:hypothetical protein
MDCSWFCVRDNSVDLSWDGWWCLGSPVQAAIPRTAVSSRPPYFHIPSFFHPHPSRRNFTSPIVWHSPVILYLRAGLPFLSHRTATTLFFVPTGVFPSKTNGKSVLKSSSTLHRFVADYHRLYDNTFLQRVTNPDRVSLDILNVSLNCHQK